jgi:hypothetical protein
MYYYVNYSPWLTEAIDSLPQLEKGLHWNNIYDNKESNLCIADIRLSIEEKLTVSIPDHIWLFQNYPNPFNSTTIIRYQLSNFEHTYTSLKIYNLAGEEVKRLVAAEQSEGEYQVIWDGKDEQGNEVSSGMYLCRLSIGSTQQVRKLILQR